MSVKESISNSNFNASDTIAARTHALLVEIEKHDELQWRIYDLFRHHDPDQWRVCDYFWKKAPDMNLGEYHALHEELGAAIDSSNKTVANIIFKSNVSDDVVTQIFLAAKELLDHLLLNQEQQLVLYSTHLINISKHVSFLHASLRKNITITNKIIMDLRTKVFKHGEVATHWPGTNDNGLFFRLIRRLIYYTKHFAAILLSAVKIN